MKKIMLIIILTLATTLIIGIHSSGSYYTDSVQTSDNTFTADSWEIE